MTTPGLTVLRAMRRAKDLMDRDWAEPLDLDAVARHAGYSRFHFVRLFGATYGETPGQYLSRRRIERAEELLRTANLSVTEICGLVGFTSLGTFSTRFRQRTGLSPRAYRERWTGGGAALIPGCYALLWAGGFGPRRSPTPSPQSVSPQSVSPRSASPRSASPRSAERRNSGEADPATGDLR